MIITPREKDGTNNTDERLLIQHQSERADSVRCLDV